jgi:hypothetical protein
VSIGTMVACTAMKLHHSEIRMEAPA